MKAVITNIELAIAAYAAGRVLFHLVCLVRDHHLRFHTAGIVREFRHR